MVLPNDAMAHASIHYNYRTYLVLNKEKISRHGKKN